MNPGGPIKVNAIFASIFAIGVGTLLLAVGASSYKPNMSCVMFGLMMIVLGIVCVVNYCKVRSPEGENDSLQDTACSNDSSAGTIQTKELEDSEDEDDYEYIEVKSYVRRKRKK